MSLSHLLRRYALVLGLIVVLLLIGLAFWYFTAPGSDETVTTVAMQPVRPGDLDFSFSYPAGEEGYSLIEPPVPAENATTSGALVGAYLLMQTPEYIAYQQAGEGEQTPPTISLFVYNAPEAAEGDTRSRKERLLDWARENATLTDIPDVEITETEIDGAPAYYYTAENTYPQETYLVAYKGKYFLFTGQHREAGDTYSDGFATVIDAVLFY